MKTSTSLSNENFPPPQDSSSHAKKLNEWLKDKHRTSSKKKDAYNSLFWDWRKDVKNAAPSSKKSK